MNAIDDLNLALSRYKTFRGWRYALIPISALLIWNAQSSYGYINACLAVGLVFWTPRLIYWFVMTRKYPYFRLSRRISQAQRQVNQMKKIAEDTLAAARSAWSLLLVKDAALAANAGDLKWQGNGILLFEKYLWSESDGGWIKEAKSKYLPASYGYEKYGSKSETVHHKSGDGFTSSTTTSPEYYAVKTSMDLVKINGPEVGKFKLSFPDSLQAQSFQTTFSAMVSSWDTPIKDPQSQPLSLRESYDKIVRTFDDFRSIVSKAQNAFLEALPVEVATWITAPLLEVDLTPPKMKTLRFAQRP